MCDDSGGNLSLVSVAGDALIAIAFMVLVVKCVVVVIVVVVLAMRAVDVDLKAVSKSVFHF